METVRQVLEMLVAAYPMKALHENTIKIYALSLRDVEPAALQKATLRHIQGSTFFPTIAELLAGVKAVQSQRENEVLYGRHEQKLLGQVALDLRHTRHELLQAAYAGDVDAAGFGELIASYRRAGREFGAVSLENKLAKFMKGGEAGR